MLDYLKLFCRPQTIDLTPIKSNDSNDEKKGNTKLSWINLCKLISAISAISFASIYIYSTLYKNKIDMPIADDKSLNDFNTCFADISHSLNERLIDRLGMRISASEVLKYCKISPELSFCQDIFDANTRISNCIYNFFMHVSWILNKPHEGRTFTHFRSNTNSYLALPSSTSL